LSFCFQDFGQRGKAEELHPCRVDVQNPGKQMQAGVDAPIFPRGGRIQDRLPGLLDGPFQAAKSGRKDGSTGGTASASRSGRAAGSASVEALSLSQRAGFK